MVDAKVDTKKVEVGDKNLDYQVFYVKDQEIYAACGDDHNCVVMAKTKEEVMDLYEDAILHDTPEDEIRHIDINDTYTFYCWDAFFYNSWPGDKKGILVSEELEDYHVGTYPEVYFRNYEQPDWQEDYDPDRF